VRPTFCYDDQRFHVGDLKVTEVEALEKQLGCRYVEIYPLGTMSHKVALTRMFLARSHPPDVVDKIVADLTMDQVDKMWTIEEDDLPEIYEDGLPLEVGERSTPTS
jgi:hypothetical protein